MAKSKMETSEVFRNAQNRFLDSLGPEIRSLYAPCATRDELRQTFRDLERTAQDTSCRVRSLRGLYSFAISTEKYFDVVNILVSSHPEFTALFWGAFRLVLQVNELQHS